MVDSAVHTLLTRITRVFMERRPGDKEFAEIYLDELVKRIDPVRVRNIADEIVKDADSIHNPVVLDTVLKPGKTVSIRIVVGKDSILEARAERPTHICVDNKCVDGRYARLYFGEPGLHRFSATAEEETHIVVEHHITPETPPSLVGNLWSIWVAAVWVSRNLVFKPEPHGLIEIKSLDSILETMTGDFDELVILLSSLYLAMGIRPAIILYDLTLNGYPDGAAVAVPYPPEKYAAETRMLLHLLGLYRVLAEPLDNYTILPINIDGEEHIVIDPFHNPDYLPGYYPRSLRISSQHVFTAKKLSL